MDGWKRPGVKYVRNVYSLFLAVQMSYQKARSRGGSKGFKCSKVEFSGRHWVAFTYGF